MSSKELVEGDAAGRRSIGPRSLAWLKVTVPSRVLMLVENASVPGDRRVWMEALTLRNAGYGVSVISPQKYWPKRYEELEGVSIYRFPCPSMPGIAGPTCPGSTWAAGSSMVQMAVVSVRPYTCSTGIPSIMKNN